jgi:hypothetical protein
VGGALLFAVGIHEGSRRRADGDAFGADGIEVGWTLFFAIGVGEGS